ncbi:uncharacterized protein KY384_002702 [Bacidia gigantensis]|uniref:uncharacterized protein n=1 Tax=Bacidia gigantensis TaxID=2732470 RepID=UPI001D04F4D7|nr:uncharacterized protein KY384_002702 [Bacidia gigantensis]KAG8532824.1 hypothetical protein KY384_002702 [Bacidia gigantensis]
MDTAGPPGQFGATAQAGAVVHDVFGKAGELLPNKSEDGIKAHDESGQEKLGFKSNPGAPTPPQDTDTSSSSDLDKAISDPKVQQLARQVTAHSVKTKDGQNYPNPFTEGEDLDPQLDPSNPQFRPESWVRTLIGIQSRDPELYPQRVAGISYQNLNVHGFGSLADYQKTFGNYPLSITSLWGKLTGRGQRKIQILRDFDGLVRSGEMLVVLGRPGSGCTTLLKTISGRTHGFFIDEASEINYQGIPKETMHKDFRGECMYQAEIDVHFPQLTVGQTLKFAAEAKAPRNRLPGVTRDMYAEHMTKVIMAVFGISHTFNTKVGNEYIRGVSGGERKRVSIAEAALGASPLQCWDNSTRGLDSATALEFVKTLRISTSLSRATAAVAIYQASQGIYDIFDKVVVLYEGRQIYFGPTESAKLFFVDMGFYCTDRATTGDFLTSLTNPAERVVREGFEHLVPRTPDEFAQRWQQSPDRAQLLEDIAQFNKEFPVGGQELAQFQKSRKATMAKGQRAKSPYTLSIPMQVKLCLYRGFQRLQGDASITLTSVIGNSVMAIIIGSVFYNLPHDTGSFYYRGALLFFAVLLNAFASFLEILTLYAQRPIVEKQAQYAFYHPFSEAIASMLCDLPSKFFMSISFNVTLYFLSHLRRTPGAFFTFYLFSLVTTLTMSMLFRFIGACSKTLAQAMAPAAVSILALIIYTGFAIPVRDMHPWFRWIGYIDPVAYAFESLMINEFQGEKYKCVGFVPAYPGLQPDQHVCNTIGSIPGQDYVDGTRYINEAFSYYDKHKWRNLGVLIAMMIGLCAAYLIAAELVAAQRSKGEVLVFPRGKIPGFAKKKSSSDEEEKVDDRPTADGAVIEKTVTAGDVPPSIQKQTAIFHWQAVNYDIKIKGEGRRILNDVDGWVKPGTLTALMGATGAGKTSLLDTLASRVTMGVVTGQMLVNGRQRDSGFQRKTGYVQQQDLHLATSTVREALNFSALLRQPKTTPKKEKLEYVEEVIKVLEMESYADAVVGVLGEGLNVEQRKRLTIGVELAARPALLLFLDEPTSGLDSQTAWSIVALLRKLANNGQAILCTIHQPSAVLFQEFDRLLFLVYGGKTVYFGDIGHNSRTLTSYFEHNGARTCGVEENPAEWMLDIVGAAPGSQNTTDWGQVWRESPEKQQVRATLANMKRDLSKLPAEDDPASLREFAESFTTQLLAVQNRVFQQYWRTPYYLYSKLLLCLATAIFIGFSFWDSAVSIQGLQNQLFSIFMLMTMFGNLVQQILPHFVTQRALYESRERPSKTYGWKVFMLSQIFVEIPWNTLMSVLIFVCFYYPIGMYRNAQPTHALNQRSTLFWLFIWQFLLFTSTFTDMIIAGIELAETAGNIGQLLFSLTLIFCGVLAGPVQLPGFWIFMYRVSPFTYLIDGMLSTGLANTQVKCSSIEYINFNPTAGKTCSEYMADYISAAGGYLTNPNATTQCNFCTASDTNTYLSALSSSYSNRWRNFGIMWAFIIFNTAAALFLYWLARVPRKQKVSEEALPDPETLSRSQTKSDGLMSKVQSKVSYTSLTKEQSKSTLGRRGTAATEDEKSIPPVPPVASEKLGKGSYEERKGSSEGLSPSSSGGEKDLEKAAVMDVAQEKKSPTIAEKERDIRLEPTNNMSNTARDFEKVDSVDAKDMAEGQVTPKATPRVAPITIPSAHGDEGSSVADSQVSPISAVTASEGRRDGSESESGGEKVWNTDLVNRSHIPGELKE